MKKDIKRLTDVALDPGKYYILLSAGTGDTLVYLGLRKYMEREWGGTIRYLIRPSHEVIMKMYGVEEYDVLDFDAEGFDRCCPRLTELSDQCPRPLKGAVWVAFPWNHREMDPNHVANWKAFRMRDYFEIVLNLSPSCWEFFERPSSDAVSVSDSFVKRLSDIGDISQMVLLAPDAGDKKLMTRELDKYWEQHIKMYKEQGLTVIVNSLHPLPLAGAIHLSMTLEEALWLGLHCHSILALRSGICDLLAFFRTDDMTVIYKDHWLFYQFNFNDFLGLRLKEKIVLPPSPPKKDTPGKVPPPNPPKKDTPGKVPPPNPPKKDTPGKVPPPNPPKKDAPGKVPPPNPPKKDAPGKVPPPNPPKNVSQERSDRSTYSAQMTKYYLMGGIRVLSVFRPSPNETRYYFCGIPIVRICVRNTTKRIRVLGITLWKIAKRQCNPPTHNH